ncbi:aminoglycoside phosphotransferase family protein [Angustibacter luteus]|uniref:Aminoglycoside phosphotransferase family protein n=1 Tax=Angustibacter luteus TaxID=658456 RepID=A0ABW1J8P3_9ACTN
MLPDPIEEAIEEARRRQAIADRDTSDSVNHFASSVRAVCRRWNLTAQRWLPGGAGAPTLAVTGVDGTAGVLKIAEPGSLDDAVRVMLAADGQGYARVLCWDADRGALLTERLGGDLWTHAATLVEQAQLVVPLLQLAWRVPLDRGRPFPGKASGLLDILADLGPRYGAHHADVLARASRYATELAASERPQVVCHGDPHAGNVLRRGSGWALIDPDGFVGERAYDLGVVLRDGCREIVAAEASRAGAGASVLRRACQVAAGLADVDAEQVWRWSFVERVTTGLYLRWFGHHDESASFLGAADLLSSRER